MEPKSTQEVADSSSFVAYLQSTVDLDTLANITRTLDEELQNSQRVMADIKSMFSSVPNQCVLNTDNGLRHEDLSKFLEAGVPNLLLPDMIETSAEVNLDSIISKMRGYTEDIKKNIVPSPPRPQIPCDKMKSLDMEQYACSLDQLSKRLATIKLKQEEGNCRDPQLEDKLEQLCQDVDMFTQVVQTKTKLKECNENWKECQLNGTALQYEAIINKLLGGINEVMYLIKNKD